MKLLPLSVAAAEESFLFLALSHSPKTPHAHQEYSLLPVKKGEQMTRVAGHSSSQKLLLLLAILALRVLCDLRKARRGH
jgi:hypothetical protein